MKKICSFMMCLITVFLLAACTSPEPDETVIPTKAEETVMPPKEDETVVPTEAEKKEQEGVFLNKVLQNDTKNVYTYDANLGNMFEFVVTPTENELLILGMVVAEQHTAAGLVLDTKDLCSEKYNENAVLCLIYMNIADGTYEEYYNVTHPDIFQNVRFELNTYSYLQQADYLLSADVVLNGTTYSLCGNGLAEYTEAQMQGNSQSGDETCTYCGGSGICHVCNGMGYTAWGGYENRIDCSACDVPGECYYCQGTGIQVYLVRGVLKQ